MDSVFKRRKRFFSLLPVVFLYTANRPDENELIQFFEGTSVHKLACA